TSPRILHVIVKPDAWTAPFTVSPFALPRPVRPVPTRTTLPATSPATSRRSPPSPSGAETARPMPPSDAPAATAPPLAPSATGTTTTPTPSLGPTVSGYPTYLAFLAQLIPLQRALLLLNLQKAHYFYSVDVQ